MPPAYAASSAINCKIGISPYLVAFQSAAKIGKNNIEGNVFCWTEGQVRSDTYAICPPAPTS